MSQVDESQAERLSKLMQLAQEGDEGSYQELLEEAALLIRKFVSRRIANDSAAEDILQETLISIHRARHTFDPKQKFGPWMYAIARHKLIDHFRKQQRLADREVLTDAVIDLPAPEEEDFALSEELQNAVSGLPEKQQTAIRLLKLEGLTVKEAAKKTGMSEAAIKVNAHRGYKTLRKKMEKHTT